MIELTVGQIQNKMSHIQNVKKTISDYIDSNKVNNKKKKSVKTMGEVMTPIKLVEEMIDTLPDEVWTNPALKWLDPCNGIGTFFSVVVERLMKGLTNFQPNDNLRYKHIVEEMIYACELQEKNITSYIYTFDPDNEYTLNTYCGSYLDEGFDNQMGLWDVEKFDVIVMNPPYQELKEGNKKSQAIWDRFVIKTVEQLVEGGYLVAVHPDGWRNAVGAFKNIQILLKSKQLLYLEVHSKKDGIKTFGVHTTYDFYCLHNVPCTTLTTIKCQDGTIERVNISQMEFIPNGMFNEFEKLIAKDSVERVNLLSNSSYHTQRVEQMSKEQTDDFKYPCIYLTYKDGSINLWYSNTNTKGHFGIPKVIWSNGTSTPIVDETGKYGLTQFAYAIVDEPKNLPFIQKAMLNPDFMKLMSFSDGNTGVSGHRYNRKVIALFRKDFWREFQDTKNGDERVNIIYSRSAYGNDKPHMSKEQTEEFKYPCVYLTYKDGSINLWYSNTKEKGHFGIPKVIFSKGTSHPIIDETGEYGVMNFAYAIVDEPKNLPFIQKAMLHPDFIKLMSFSDGNTGQRYNKKAIALFRKDFWRDFQD